MFSLTISCLDRKANISPKDNLLLKIDEEGRIILVKKDIYSDLEDLIKKDLIKQGFSEKDFDIKIPERKKELAKALLKMAEEAKSEINNGEYSTLEDIRHEFNQGNI